MSLESTNYLDRNRDVEQVVVDEKLYILEEHNKEHHLSCQMLRAYLYGQLCSSAGTIGA